MKKKYYKPESLLRYARIRASLLASSGFEKDPPRIVETVENAEEVGGGGETDDTFDARQRLIEY